MFEEIVREFKENLLPRAKEAFKKAIKAFLETFWSYIKDEVILSARRSLKIIEALIQSPEIKESKEAIINLIMLKIKLPLILKPFKGLVRSMISNKIDEVLTTILGKGFEILG